MHFLGETLNKHCSELAFPTYDAVDIVFRLFDVFWHALCAIDHKSHIHVRIFFQHVLWKFFEIFEIFEIIRKFKEK